MRSDDSGRPHLGRARFGVAYAFLTHGVMFGAWASRIPVIKDQAGLDATSLGFSLLAASAGAVLAMSFAGVLAGRLGSHVMTVAMLLGYAAMVPILALANSFVTLTATLLILGAFQGSMDVAMNANALSVEQAGTRPIMSRLHGTWSLGSFVGAFVTIVSVSAGLSLFAQFCLLGAWMALSAAVLLRTMLPHRQPVEGSAFRLPPRALLPLGFLIYCGMLAEGSAGDWSGVYMRTDVLSTQQEAALTLGAFSAAMALSRLVGDRMTEWLGGARLVTVGAILGASGLGLALTLHVPAAAIAGFTMLGLGLGSIVPIALRAGGSRPDIPAGIGIAAISTMGYAGMLSGPPIIGTVAGATGIRAALALVVALLVVLAVMARRVVSEPITLPEPAVPIDLA
ncbi:MAG: MFS transporter [Candidatus Limnocylindrales bacterium]